MSAFLRVATLLDVVRAFLVHHCLPTRAAYVYTIFIYVLLSCLTTGNELQHRSVIGAYYLDDYTHTTRKLSDSFLLLLPVVGDTPDSLTGLAVGADY